MHEASLHAQNCFLTLTYDDANVPHGIDLDTGEIGAGELLSLNKRDIVLFLKRLRKRVGVKIRYLQCGEYGSRTNRPHHHVLLFGYDFPDKVFLAHNKRVGVSYYTSALLSDLWGHGHVVIGDVTFESAAYVARYCLKKVVAKVVELDDGTKVDLKDLHYLGRTPEFITMSLKPGIAHDWIVNNLSDVYPNDHVYVRPGVVARPPSYYDKIYDCEKKDFFRIRRKRVMQASKRPQDGVRRLIDREIHANLRASQLVRNVD